MARTALTPIALGTPYGGALVVVTWTAADVANKNQFALTANEIILIRNTNGAGAHNVTLTSVDDPYGRAENITESVAASGHRAFRATDLTGWRQTDGKFYLEADNAQIEFAILKL